ncbi:MAG TPA: hypothetical protein ENJ82_08670 [Bacteroidetes bacterium]|nr:hypothetical protein [Bacteroidota bacterium]
MGRAKGQVLVEGDSYAYDSSLIPTNTGYAQMGQFEQIVETVGEDNVNSAYFKGKIDRLGINQ